MPVLYLPPPPPSGGGTPWPPVEPSQTTRITWTSQSGEQVVLTDWRSGWTLLDGATGLGMPEYTFYRRESGALDGDVVTGVRADPREIFLPIRVHARDREHAIQLRRWFASLLDPQRGRGVLTVEEADGSRRKIVAHYESGAEGDMSRGVEGLTWFTWGLTFRAEQPFWELPERALVWRGPQQAGTWLPILPLEVTGSAVIGEGMEIDITGGVDTWPVWTLTGPMAPGVELVNRTTGRWLRLRAGLDAGDVLVIDTRPRVKTLRLNGERAYRMLDQPGSVLWPLKPGRQTIDVVATGMTEESELRLAYTPLTPTS